ncbi:EAL domain-containing response regulator [Parathermosynechococcus lividus]
MTDESAILPAVDECSQNLLQEWGSPLAQCLIQPSQCRIPVFSIQVLIIENIPQLGEILQPYLQTIECVSYRVQSCLFGQLTLSLVAEARPDVLVLMCHDDQGLTQVEILHERFPQVPLVVIGKSDCPDVATQALHSGAQDYLSVAELTPHLVARSLRNAIHRHHVEQRLVRQAQYDRLLVQLTQHIHQSLDLSAILESTVQDVRQLLGCDRVLVYRFLPDWRGIMDVEAVVPPWQPALGDIVGDSCFTERYIDAYRRGRVHIVNNVDTMLLETCYRELLQHYQVRANLVVPITVDGRLWGLLICHQCAQPREWHDSEVELLKQISTQLAIAILQAELYQKAQTELQERKVVEAQLLYQARHDPLTHLPNRWLFEEHLHTTLQRAARQPNYQYAVLCLDLDHFKTVNDSLGHSVGDLYLQEVAQRLSRHLSPQDIVARLGGDEFGVLLNDLRDVDHAYTITTQLRDRLASTFAISHYTLHGSVSIGLVMGDRSYSHPEELLRDADTAMYHAKAKGRNRIAIFDQPMLQKVRHRLRLEVELRQAVEHGDFELYYQPIVNLRTQALVGFETLIRWQKDGQMLPPDEFIPVAEETGLIFEISRWVLHAACRQLRDWQQRYPKMMAAGLTLSVNLSGSHFSLPTLVTEIEQALHSYHLWGQFLKLEITESALMKHLESARELLLCIKSMGIRVAIDDFGTGYSSLSYLRSLPLDCIKIDRSFISTMDSSREDLEVVHTILLLAQNLRLDCVAEGVETTNQLQQLRSLRCPHGQGYLFSPPLSADQAELYLQKHLVT